MIDILCYCLVTKSCLIVFETPWTVAHQAPFSMGFPRQEYGTRLQFHSPEDIPDRGNIPTSGIEPESPALQADSLPLSHQ